MIELIAYYYCTCIFLEVELESITFFPALSSLKVIYMHATLTIVLHSHALCHLQVEVYSLISEFWSTNTMQQLVCSCQQYMLYSSNLVLTGGITSTQLDLAIHVVGKRCIEFGHSLIHGQFNQFKLYSIMDVM